MNVEGLVLDKSQLVEGLLVRYGNGLVRYTTNILRDKEAAKEIVQECFLKLLQIKEDVPPEFIQAWLYRECRNRAFDAWGKTRRVDRLDDLGDEAVGFSASDPLRDLETQRNLSQMHEAIAKLSDRQQEALFLKYKDGLSYKEIAEVMGLSSTNVGFILCEAMKFLRDVSVAQEEVLAKRNYGE